MIYLFSHGNEQIDGVYQSHPIRIILADQIYDRPMQNNVYSYMIPYNQNEIRNCLQEEEEIILDLSEESFEPSIMFQLDQSIGLIDVEQDSYRLYAKDDRFRLITTYQNIHNERWKLTGGVIFKDNRTLLKLTEDKSYSNMTDRLKRTNSHQHPQRCLIELTPDGEEQRQIQANALYSMVLDE
jgi:hypothetical protein